MAWLCAWKMIINRNDEHHSLNEILISMQYLTPCLESFARCSWSLEPTQGIDYPEIFGISEHKFRCCFQKRQPDWWSFCGDLFFWTWAQHKKYHSQEQLSSDKLDGGDHRPQRQVHLGGGHPWLECSWGEQSSTKHLSQVPRTKF